MCVTTKYVCILESFDMKLIKRAGLFNKGPKTPKLHYKKFKCPVCPLLDFGFFILPVYTCKIQNIKRPLVCILLKLHAMLNINVGNNFFLSLTVC